MSATRIAFRVLPYGLAALSLVLVIVGLVAVFGKVEAQSTPVGVGSVTNADPAQRWLKISGGGLFLPEALEDYKQDKDSGNRKSVGFYVPVVTSEQATQWAAALAENKPMPYPSVVVYVKFSAEEYLKQFPAPDQVKPADYFRPFEPEGLRVDRTMVSGRLKDFLVSENRLTLDRVVVIDQGEHPIQKGEGGGMSVVGLLGAVSGGFWIRRRLKK